MTSSEDLLDSCGVGRPDVFWRTMPRQLVHRPATSGIDCSICWLRLPLNGNRVVPRGPPKPRHGLFVNPSSNGEDHSSEPISVVGARLSIGAVLNDVYDADHWYVAGSETFVAEIDAQRASRAIPDEKWHTEQFLPLTRLNFV